MDDVLARLGIDDTTAIAPCWDQSIAIYPNDGILPFLDHATISESRKFAGLPADVDGPLFDTADHVRSLPDLSAFAWHLHCLVYEHLDNPEWPNTRHWPYPIPALGEATGALYLLIALAAIPRMRAAHARRGIPETISRDCCSHYPVSLANFREHYGSACGIAPRSVYWVRNHAQGDLIRLGRLEYMVKPFNGPLVAYRHQVTGAVAALAASGTRFREDGFLAFEDEAAAFVAHSAVSGQVAAGTPLSPEGRALNSTVELPLSEWRQALAPGDPILEVHIPAGGGMTPEKCRDSMQQALEFFPRYHPELPFNGFACRSWILNPELEQIYRPDSNMVLWQRELYLFPSAGGRGSIYFVFGQDDIDPETAPRDTSLRRALLDHMATGQRFQGGGMFLLTEDFAEFGTQVYRRRWPGMP